MRHIFHPIKTLILIVLALFGLQELSAQIPPPVPSPSSGTNASSSPVRFGAYYFDGWAGTNKDSGNPTQPWALNAPTHLSQRLLEEFPGRKPIWGWRDDTMSIMEQQITLAADNGIDFFAFCWYWHDQQGPIHPEAIMADSKQTGLNLFLKAPNNSRMRFCLLVANHKGSEIIGTEAWKQAADYWIPYLKNPRAVTVGGKPLIIIFSIKKADKEGLAYLQEAAKRAGLPGVAIAGVTSPSQETLEQGFNFVTRYNIQPKTDPNELKQPYASLSTAAEQAWSGSPQQPLIPTISIGWDRRPWEAQGNYTQGNKNQSHYFPDRTPEAFESFLRKAVAWMDAHPEETNPDRLAVIYAWNELVEGGYLVPTQEDPNGLYLRAIRRVVRGQ